MKAIIHRTYGSPDVLEYVELEKPTPSDDEVLIKVEAAGVNPLDWRKLRAQPFLIRTSEGMRKPNDIRLGADVAGRVEAVGRSVTEFQVGDEVFGEISKGAFAEYVSSRSDLLAPMPEDGSFVESAASPVAAITALQGLRDHGQIKAGQRVLINGASGGVGTYAVQIAKAFDTQVTGVCSTAKLEMVHSIGADHVIDYTTEDFSRSGQRYDLIFDIVGNLSMSKYRRSLTSNGIGVIAGFTTLPRMFGVIVGSLWRTKTSDQTISMMLAKPTQADLNYLRELMETGKLRSVVDRTFPLHKTAEAIRYLESGRACGKVVITTAA